MKPSKKLINALRKTALQVEEGEIWDWDNPLSCNCGLLVRNLGVPKDLIKRNVCGFWTTSKCVSTGLDTNLLTQVLKDYGIGYEEIVELEHIGREVLERDPDTSEETPETLEKYRKIVCSYLREKADLLESQIVRPSNPILKEVEASV